MIEVHSSKGLDYKRISCEVEKSVVTDRSFSFYRTLFGYRRESLSGKLILDVGAGDSSFAATAARHKARAIRLDPQYSLKELSFKWGKKDAVRGIVQELPFQDNVFDETIACYSLTWITSNIRESLLEMIRVTKPNGKIRICPVYPRKDFLKMTISSAIKPYRLKSGPEGECVLTISRDTTYSSKNNWEMLADELLGGLAI